MPKPDIDRSPAPSRLTRLAVMLSASLAPALGWAVCTCGFGDGLFTLATINVDGNMADWAPIHADTDNNVCDGPANGLTDRDAPIQSTGRDLTHFAFTWDANNIYLFTERFGSATNSQTFVYYADVDNDGLMETGEPVIGVTWQGSNRSVNVYTFTYVEDAPGGDPMVDGGGFGDGYTLPGDFANVPGGGSPNRSGTWGSADGLQMEFFVTWAELGLTPGAAFTFHVSSSNASLNANNFAAQVDDNLAGCGGTSGSTIIPGAVFTPNRTLVGFASQTVTAAHTLTNPGNATDTYDLSSISAGDFAPDAIRYYHDVDLDGVVTVADTLLTDTDGDGDPNSPAMAMGETIEILIEYDVPAGASNGDISTVTTTAASDYEPLANDFVVDTIEVALPPDILVNKASLTVEDPINGTTNPKAIPGARVRYTVTLTNQGTGTVDVDTTVIVDPVPANMCLRVVDTGAPGSGPVVFQDGTPMSGLTYTFTSLGDTLDDVYFSNDGGLTYTYTPTANGSGCDPAVSHIRINPKGVFAADTGGGSPNFDVAFDVLVD